MGWPPSGDHDDLHSCQSRRNRQLDPLHKGQEGSCSVVGRTFVTHAHAVQKQKLGLLILFNLVVGVETFVKITVSESYLLVPENSNVNLTCHFVNNQGAEPDEINGKWKWITKGQIFTEGVEMVWNEVQQEGKTTLQISNVTREKEGKYACVIWVRESFDHGYLDLRILNTSYKTNPEEKVQVVPLHEEVDMWDGPPPQNKLHLSI